MHELTCKSQSNSSNDSTEFSKMLLQKLLSKQAVADILGVHPQTVMRLVRRGTFPPPLRTGDIGSAVRWRTQDINNWIEHRAGKEVA